MGKFEITQQEKNRLESEIEKLLLEGNTPNAIIMDAYFKISLEFSNLVGEMIKDIELNKAKRKKQNQVDSINRRYFNNHPCPNFD